MISKNLRLDNTFKTKSVYNQYPVIDSCLEDGFRVSERKYFGPIIISKRKVINWKISNKKISIFHFDNLKKINYKAEFVLLGIGKKFEDPHNTLKAKLIQKDINLEIMSTYSACRVWNLTIQENRNIVGFFIPLNFF